VLEMIQPQSGVGFRGQGKAGSMKNQQSGVGNGSCVDRNHAPLAVLALAAVFRELREERGLSLNQLHKLSHVSRQTLTAIEKQEYFPMVESIARVAEGLGIPFGQFCLKVDRWQARQPRCCRACRYSCMAEGRLKELDSHRKCTRLITEPSAPAASLPDSR